ncbi:hypothetical protein MNBD_GAMMA11-1998 [hydrothermal vent metagenome]|uniref:Uncharacterized protein n=1 Tax=hydrothermal vent metagenome TaxID=652676 RepID=A0A3B0XP15_9ZZZZ
MQLDKIIIALRQRNSWEAMDLGVQLMRGLWPVILFPWLILISGVLVFALFVQYLGYGILALIFMWWIKPVYESMLLHILSRSVFGEYPSTSDVLSFSAGWLKTGLFTSLFFWRFSPARSFNMSVHLLEGLKGNARRKRLLSLHRVAGLNSAAVTIIGVHFETVLGITLYSVIFFIAPDIAADYFSTDTENSAVMQDGRESVQYVVGIIVYGVTLFIFEPFYVAAGFMLYLNRRTQLEGWDIEIDFKKLVQRIGQQPGMHIVHSQSPLRSENHV